MVRGCARGGHAAGPDTWRRRKRFCRRLCRERELGGMCNSVLRGEVWFGEDWVGPSARPGKGTHARRARDLRDCTTSSRWYWPCAYQTTARDCPDAIERTGMRISGNFTGARVAKGKPELRAHIGLDTLISKTRRARNRIRAELPEGGCDVPLGKPIDLRLSLKRSTRRSRH